MPARRRRGGDRAARECVGAAAPQVVARARCRRCGSAWPRRACSSADAASASTRSSSATPATSTSRRHGGSPAGGRSSSTRSSRCTRPSSRTAAVSRPARPQRASCARSTGSRSGAPTSSSPTPAQNARHLAELGELPAERLAVCFVGAEERLFRPGWQPPQEFHALFVGKLIPLHGVETILAAARLAPEIPFRIVGSGQLDGLLARAPAERRVGRVGRVRAPAGGAPARRVRARGLRHLGEDGPRDPEQGVPGARLRDAARDRGHPGRTRAARRRKRAAGPRRRPRGAGGSGAAAGERRQLARRIGDGGLAAYRARASEAVLGERWRDLVEQLVAR